MSLDNIAGDSGTVIGWEKSSDYSSQSVELYPEDVAYARLRPYLNKVAHIDCEALGSAELIVLPKSQAILPRYLQHSLLSPSFCAFAQHESTGDRPRLKWRQMQEYEIALPPIDEQARIVAAIEEHFSRLDAAAESLRASHGKLRSLPSVLAKTAIRGWASEQLGEVAEVFVGSTPSRSRPELWDGSIPWVSSGEVQFCRIRETRESVSVGAVKSDRIHPPGTVLLGMIGEGKTRGQAAILEIAAAHNQNSAAIRVDHSRLMPEWLYYVFRAQYEANRGVGSGNNQPALNKSRVRELVVPLPPLSEQDRLIKGLNEAMDAIDHADAEVQRAQQRCSALYKSLLSEAFSGRLVPQDPNDEPASALLERIADSR
ncbi:restriction endonuclease subunit S [Candidatus Poriferisocius sp.]|uniref:restriction endonuclease subunit S n=1 Tax=Candidatus Poriferisocius sp. TaxID=3101276 RepID=UPI003B01779B